MGKYPVISISLKGINAAAYEDAFDFAVQIMQRTAEEFQFLSDSEYLSEHDKSVYRELLDSNMSETVFCGGLKILSKLLEKHYRLKVILLIDEYDVPLAKAFENGYYEQMIFQDYVMCFRKTIGSTPAVMMPSRNLFKCPTILKPSVRLKLCLPAGKS